MLMSTSVKLTFCFALAGGAEWLISIDRGAMRAGVACVASACDGIPEDVTHLSDAWLTMAGDHQSLAKGSLRCIRTFLCETGSQMLGGIPSKDDFSGDAFSQAPIEMRSALDKLLRL